MDKKIFDCVFSSGDLELIKKRIHTNEEFVSHTFIILNEENSPQIASHFSANSLVTVIKENEDFENYKFYSELIRIKIKNHFKSFDDLVFISDDNQIPFMGIFLQNSEEKNHSYLCHKICSFDESKCHKFLSKGSIIVSVSEMTTNRNFLSLKNSLMKETVGLDDTIESGITFLKNSEELEDKYFCSLSKKYIPFDVRSDDKIQNFLISFVGLDITKIDKYDKIFLVELCGKFPEFLESETEEKIQKIKIFQPKFEIYTDNNFYKNYLKRESIRILNFTNKVDNDIVWIQFEDGIESFRVRELKNPS
jgi:hypothetical protein